MCGKLSDCGGRKTFASCTSYEGFISDYSYLNSCDCHSVEDTTADLYKLIDDIMPNVKLEDFDKKCLDIQQQKDGTYLAKDVIQALVEKQCEETATEESSECSDCADPCTPNPCKSVFDYRYKEGETVISTAYNDWSPPPYSDMAYVTTSKGDYKITIDLGCSPEDPSANCLIGVSLNDNNPVGTPTTNPFVVSKVDPEFNSKTFHFILTNVAKDTKIQIMFKKNGSNVVLVDGMKQIIEKL